jgi:type I restriction enzyme, S subunit
MSIPKTKNWPMVPLGELITDTRNGLYKPDTFYGSGVPILKMFNIGRLDGTWNLQNLDRVRLTSEEHALSRLNQGDLLVNRVNSRELVGKCAVVDEATDGFVFESKNLRLRVDHNRIVPEWVAYWLNGEGGRNQIEDKAKQAIGQATINRGDLDGISIPLPSLAEQRRLAGELREQLAAVAEARAALKAQLAAVERLPGALLREVFGAD